MELYWKERRTGQRLLLVMDDGEELEVGGVRRTPRGFNAFAKTTGYDPGRAQNDIASMEEAKVFVESFRPWEDYVGHQPLEVESGVRPVDDDAPSQSA